MTTTELYKELNYVNHSREKRLKYANLVIDNPELISSLLKILFEVNDKISCRAAWVLEYACREDINLILPYIDSFTNGIPSVKLDAAVRPVAKICECLAEAYYSNTINKVKNTLSLSHIDKIVAVCFDYLISDEKIAPKAYSMNTLFLFGKDLDWIHPELKMIIERDYQMQSSGFKARARHILKKLSKLRL